MELSKAMEAKGDSHFQDFVDKFWENQVKNISCMEASLMTKLMIL